jgi:hypothetical protein
VVYFFLYQSSEFPSNAVNAFAEVPSNYLLHRFNKPSRYIGAMIMTWGSMTVVLGTVTNFSQLVAVRFL